MGGERRVSVGLLVVRWGDGKRMSVGLLVVRWVVGSE